MLNLILIFFQFNAYISTQVPRKFTSTIEGKMGYEDFVYFILSEEDKSAEPSLEYWYICLHKSIYGCFSHIFAMLTL